VAKKKSTTRKSTSTKSSAKTSARSSAKKKSATKKTTARKTSARNSTKTKASQAPTKETTKQSAAPVEDDTQLIADTNNPVVEIDRRESADRRQTDPGRRKVQRRRQIDPTTCERDYSNDEIEFMHAMDEYKRANGRMFPTCSEILEVVRSIGYQKLPLGPALPPTEPQRAGENTDTTSSVS
jgi:hypothetical protein